jgi:hypothetical protein
LLFQVKFPEIVNPAWKRRSTRDCSALYQAKPPVVVPEIEPNCVYGWSNWARVVVGPFMLRTCGRPA